MARGESGRIGRERGLYYWHEGKWQEQELTLPGTDTNLFPFRPEPRMKYPAGTPLLLQTTQQGRGFRVWGAGGYQVAEAQHWIPRVGGTDEPVSATFRA